MYKRFLARRIVPVSLATALLSFGSPANNQTSATPRVQAIRFWSFGDVTRIAIQTDGEYKLQSDQIENPPRVYFDLTGLRPPATAHRGMETIQVGDHRVKQIRVAEVSPGKTRIVFDLEGPAEVVSSQLVNPDRPIVEIRPKGTSIAAQCPRHSVTAPERTNGLLPGEENIPNPATNPPALTRPAPSEILTAYVPRSTLPPTSVGTQPAVLPETAPMLTPTVVGPPLRKRFSEIASPAKTDSSGEKSLVRVFGLKLG